MTSAFPSNSPRLSPVTGDIENIISKSNITTPNLLTARPIDCLKTRYPKPLNSPDCDYIINQVLLQQPNVLKQRTFKDSSYMTETGYYARSLWQHGNCEVSVHGHRYTSQLLTFFEIAFAADGILRECVHDQVRPKGGVCLIGDVSAGFHVVLQGYQRPESITTKNSSVAQQPAASVSRRGSTSHHHSEDSAGYQAVEIRDPLRAVSRLEDHPVVTSNSTIDTVPPTRYPVRCFNPFVIHLQPAVAPDCNYIINQIILRLFNPTRQLTFGFTDAVDVDLSRPPYQRWQYGQCLISVKNNDVAQVDTFRLLDLAATARRISMHCLVNTQEKLGGVATIGTDERGFYVYVGGPLDVILLSERSHAESF